MRYLYTVGFYFALPFILLRAIFRARNQKKHLKRIGERLGFYPFKSVTDTIWLHAVSYGEAVAAEPLLKQLKENFPSTKIYITTMTSTGAIRIENTWKNDQQIRHVFLPYDVPFAIKRFFRHVKPSLGIIMETELWPNLLYLAGAHRIPLILANARLSPRSFSKYQRVAKFMLPFLKNITLVAAQSPEDADRFMALGIENKQVTTLGNLKFDVKPPWQQISTGLEVKQKLPFEHIIVAASTHASEEEQLLDAFLLTKQQFPKALLVLVPRHPERFDEVANLCTKRGYHLVRRSSQNLPEENTSVYLGDTMGELYYFYALADIAFVGGSLIPVGGHNLLEPAALKLPIVTGPNLFNFKLIAELLRETDTLHIAANHNELYELFKRLLQDGNYRQQIGLAGFQVLAKNQGATERHIAAIISLIAQS
jgi:3-deoxy-D-manno-octulosonic-acid transferase